jgi:hypothetical protein
LLLAAIMARGSTFILCPRNPDRARSMAGMSVASN